MIETATSDVATSAVYGSWGTGVVEERTGVISVVQIPRAARRIPYSYPVEAEPKDQSRFDSDLPLLRMPVRVPADRPAQARFDALQKWEGRVLQVYDAAFSAVVVDMREEIEEEVEFDIEEVSPPDIVLVQSGAVFYWSIGYRTDPSGERTRASVLVFRRLPAWSERDLERAQQRAAATRAQFGW